MSKISYIAIKDDNKPLRVVNSALLREETDRLPKGRYRLVIDKLKKNKSNSQLGWLYACIYPFVLRGLIDAGWEEITNLDQVDAYMKSLFANTEIVNRHSGEVIKVPALKREMSTTEFSTYVEAIRQWAQSWLNVTIPDPETNIEIDFK